MITPAKIVLTRVTPDRTPWGRTVRISGRVLGGYIPASSKLLRLDLGIVGIPGLSKIQGIPNVAPDGTFTTTYKFARYQGVVRFWLRVSSLAEADFPWAPAHSRRVIVTVGVPAPPPAAFRGRTTTISTSTEHGRRLPQDAMLVLVVRGWRGPRRTGDVKAQAGSDRRTWVESARLRHVPGRRVSVTGARERQRAGSTRGSVAPALDATAGSVVARAASTATSIRAARLQRSDMRFCATVDLGLRPGAHGGWIDEGTDLKPDNNT